MHVFSRSEGAHTLSRAQDDAAARHPQLLFGAVSDSGIILLAGICLELQFPTQVWIPTLVLCAGVVVYLSWLSFP